MAAVAYHAAALAVNVNHTVDLPMAHHLILILDLLGLLTQQLELVIPAQFLPMLALALGRGNPNII